MTDRSDDPSHHKRTLLPQSYITLPFTHIVKVKWSSTVLGYVDVANPTLIENTTEKINTYCKNTTHLYYMFILYTSVVH